MDFQKKKKKSKNKSEFCGHDNVTILSRKRKTTSECTKGASRSHQRWCPMGMVKNLISMSRWPLCEVTISEETSKLWVLDLATGAAVSVFAYSAAAAAAILKYWDDDWNGGEVGSPLQLLRAGSGRVSDGEKHRRPTSHTLPTGSQHAHWHVDTSSKLTALMSADSRIVSNGATSRKPSSETEGGGGDDDVDDDDTDEGGDGGRSAAARSGATEAAVVATASGWTATAGTGFRSFFLRFRGFIMRGRLFSDVAPELSSLPPSFFLPPLQFGCSAVAFFAYFLPGPPPPLPVLLYLAACISGAPCLCAAKFAFSASGPPPPPLTPTVPTTAFWCWWWWCQYAARPYQSCSCW